MPQATLLNNIDHKNLRIITKHGADYGDNVGFTNTFPAEFQSLQAHYPIVFRELGENNFDAIALLGLTPDENLFLGAHGWDASYIPVMIQRQPFLIGQSDDQLLVHFFSDSPKVSKNADEGEPVFLEHGGPTPYLENINSLLSAIHQGMDDLQTFIKTLREHDLLESFVADIELNDGSKSRLDGFYTIKLSALQNLSASTLETMNRSGHLQSIYMVIASMSNFGSLVYRKNRRNAERA